MKITFTNLGAIKSTELDLRPLTVIIGPNNSNKTYISYSVYGLWQQVSHTYGRMRELRFKNEAPNILSIKLDDYFYDVIVKDANETVSIFKNRLTNFFQDSSGRLFSQTGFKLHITKEDVRDAVNRFIADGNYKLLPFGDVKLSIKEDVLFIEQPEQAKKATRERLRYSLELPISLAIKSYLYPTPFLLPAERNAFIITYKMLANRRYKFLRQAQRELFTRTRDIEKRQLDLLREQGDIRYPEPIEDFLDFLTDIELQADSVGSSAKKTDFSKLADDIERSIQNNHKTDLKPTKFGGKEIKINIKRGLSIDLYNASSSIKQLVPLLLYLRYRANENSLLIIDEPEMNLHPESQAKLLEILGILVNLGVQVLITTHSPYFMSHLNNLIGADGSTPEELASQAESLYLKDSRAFVKSDDVSAYEMRNNKLHSLKNEDYGIRWDTLSDVSADLQQKFFEIFEKGEVRQSGEE